MAQQPAASPAELGAPRHVSSKALRLDDPAELAEALQPLAPGVRVGARRRHGLGWTMRAWQIGGASFLTCTSDDAAVAFEENRSFVAVTVPLASTFASRVGSRSTDVEPGHVHLLAADRRGGVKINSGSHVLGFSLDADRFDAHLRAVSGAWGSSRSRPDAVVSTSTESGWQLLRFLDRICREIRRQGTTLQEAATARDVEETLGRLLAEASCADLESPRRSRSAKSVRSAEELLAADLERHLSLSDAAREVGMSTRSLSRAIRRRHGVAARASPGAGPVQDQHRRHQRGRRRRIRADQPYGDGRK